DDELPRAGPGSGESREPRLRARVRGRPHGERPGARDRSRPWRRGRRGARVSGGGDLPKVRGRGRGGPGLLRDHRRHPRQKWEGGLMETLLVETRGRVGLITLNRPKALNALNSEVLTELLEAVQRFDADEGIGAIVIRGSDRAFAAGADI